MIPAPSPRRSSRPTCFARGIRAAILRAILVAATGAALPAAGTAQDDRDIVFSTRDAAGFGDATPALREFLRAQRGTPRQRLQHFCIVGYQRDSGLRRAWVHWREGRRLILWNATAEPAALKSSLVDARRTLDLTKDVVARDEDIAGSTYLVTRAWVEKVEQDCARHGTTYVVEAPARGRR